MLLFKAKNPALVKGCGVTCFLSCILNANFRPPAGGPGGPPAGPPAGRPASASLRPGQAVTGLLFVLAPPLEAYLLIK
jgi:hypothetical protein